MVEFIEEIIGVEEMGEEGVECVETCEEGEDKVDGAEEILPARTAGSSEEFGSSHSVERGVERREAKRELLGEGREEGELVPRWKIGVEEVMVSMGRQWRGLHPAGAELITGVTGVTAASTRVPEGQEAEYWGIESGPRASL